MVCGELASNNSAIKEIAEHCGYADAAQLMHRFKRRFGLTIGEWRKTHNLP